MKMDQKWIQMLVILVFYQTSASRAGDMVVKEGTAVEIKCMSAAVCNTAIWFRVLDRSGMEFIASFARDGNIKSKPNPLSPRVDHSKIINHTLMLKSFSKAQDSGAYGCACIIGSELKFGKVTQLTGAEVATKAPLVLTATQEPPATTKACVCETSPSINCSIIILGPLAGSCGLLLLLLIITSLYCNKIRTRRCPHHYRRKQRTMAPGKQMKNYPHV